MNGVPATSYTAEGLEALARCSRRQLGMWVFLGTVTMLFAAFSSAFLVRSAGSDWQRVALPSLLWWNTALLLVSSAVLEVGRYRAKGGAWLAASSMVWIAGLFGVIFLCGQIYTWKQLVSAGILVRSGAFPASFYIISGLHGFHLLAAFLLAGYVTSRLAAASSDAATLQSLVGVCATFWHFLTGLWVYLFFLMRIL